MEKKIILPSLSDVAAVNLSKPIIALISAAHPPDARERGSDLAVSAPELNAGAGETLAQCPSC